MQQMTCDEAHTAFLHRVFGVAYYFEPRYKQAMLSASKPDMAYMALIGISYL